MYIIKMDSNKILTTTTRCPIRQYDKNVDNINFLIVPIYEGLDISSFTVTVKYILPNGTKRCEILNLNNDLYKKYLRYQLNVDTDITSQYGTVELRLIFIKADQDENGNENSYKFSTNKVNMFIEPVDCDNSTDEDDDIHNIFDKVDTMEIKLLEIENRINEYQANKADDIEIIDGEIWLMSNGEKIGDPISGKNNEWKEY